MSEYASRRGRWGWMFLDWAGQPYHTLIITFVFGPYFTSMVVPDPVQGQSIWGAVNGIAGVIMAFSAPVVGAIAERTGALKPWIAFFGVMQIVGCVALWWTAPGTSDLTLFYIGFILAFLGAEFYLVFNNAMLPSLTSKETMGRLSGNGWALGYAGGVVILALVLLFLAPPPGQLKTVIGLDPIFGLDPELGEPARASGIIAAVWLVIFALPFFLWTRDIPKREPLSMAARTGMADLKRSLRKLFANRSVGAFYLSSMLYRDGLVVLYTFGSIYARAVLGWTTFQLAAFGIVAAITGVIGAGLGGRFDDRFGPKAVVSVSIWLLLAVSVTALSTSRGAVVFVPVGAGSNLPDIVFMICGGMIGLAGGSMQASSRVLAIHATEGVIPTTEAFGLYALSGKATAFIGPFAVAATTTITGSTRLGVTPVILLFVVSLVLLAAVRPQPAVVTVTA